MPIDSSLKNQPPHLQWPGTSFACQADQRFSYRVYVPDSLNANGRAPRRLLVAVHSSTRDQQQLIDQFSLFADAHRVAILAPLFPSGIIDPSDHDNYKYLVFHGIRFDTILLSMIEEAAERFDITADKLFMFGFSGGGHFVHRFLYLHPDRLDAIFVAAPGSVTLLDPENDWWVGTRNFADIFGKAPDLEAMRRVRIALAVGENDTGESTIQHIEGRGRWMPGANGTGATRIERLAALHRNLVDNNINATLELLPGAGHASSPHVAAAKRFFAENLNEPGAAHAAAKSAAF